MTKVARKGDSAVGVCSIHGPQSGVIQSVNASKTKVEGSLVAAVGDIIQAGCGHTGSISANGAKTKVEGNQIAHVGDGFSGIYSGTITGSANNTSEG